MFALIAIVAISAVLVIIDWPQMSKRGDKREFAVYFTLLCLGIGLTVSKIWSVQVPNPLDWMAVAYKPLSKLLFGLF
ncbi:hypothetical protein PAE9249_02039 [Paenibacillus sp. CECT 9249]|uniref:hypothetical protein n=1 Tax=Paenibacillus sp. CECT 9249 TaxID=2845385 RepID=UPI001E49A07C|nr:hypothetical protein [Paenibacillus sp. CECT 9249]CAH0119535.1 hypothetical protein PAE9249_02039 [Paenibacillus sp. CECT 9249]